MKARALRNSHIGKTITLTLASGVRITDTLDRIARTDTVVGAAAIGLKNVNPSNGMTMFTVTADDKVKVLP